MDSLKVRPLVLPLIKHPSTKQMLYPHQAAMLENWNKYNTFTLVTKTGTGKTMGAVLPVLLNRQRAICVYPTNELIRDQVKNIASIAEREGLKACILTLETTVEEYSKADVILTHIDAFTLEAWCKQKHWREKWRALKELLEADKPKIIFTNPDILFLIFALRYHAEPFAALSGYNVLIVDEFHLYTGVELAHALFMLHLGYSLGFFEKIVLLSATPSPEVYEYLQVLLNDPFRVDSTTGKTGGSDFLGEERVAVHEVELIPFLAGQDIVETAVVIVKKLSEEIIKVWKQNTGVGYIPAVIVLNSVVDAIRLEDRLAEEGFKRKEMAIIRGLSAREVRNTSGKKIAIGTSAIEVGIDFQCDYLIFEASEAASFMQRFGRVGRHKPGVASVLCPPNVLYGIETLKEKGIELDRAVLEEKAYNWFPSFETRAWFVRTLMGLLSAFTLGENLIKCVREDFKATPALITEVESQMENQYTSYGQKIGCKDSILNSALYKLRKARQGNARLEWLRVYRDLNTFRTSLPSEWILDFAELERRGGVWEKAKYTADLATLLRRAEGLRFNSKIRHPTGNKGMLTVKGYGRYKKVWIIPEFRDEQIGFLHCTKDFPNMLFIQEGHKTSVSHIMSLRNHVFVVVPKNILHQLDWRLPVFECGKHLIGFDGVALILIELYNLISQTSYLSGI